MEGPGYQSQPNQMESQAKRSDSKGQNVTKEWDDGPGPGFDFIRFRRSYYKLQAALHINLLTFAQKGASGTSSRYKNAVALTEDNIA